MRILGSMPNKTIYVKKTETGLFMLAKVLGTRTGRSESEVIADAVRAYVNANREHLEGVAVGTDHLSTDR